MSARRRDKWFTGHVAFGPQWFRVTIYGANAMHWAVNIWLGWRRTYLCAHPTTWVYGYRWPWYVYVSPNATPWAATWGAGPGFERHDRELLAERKGER